jgi:hypothetical protein
MSRTRYNLQAFSAEATTAAGAAEEWVLGAALPPFVQLPAAHTG